MSIAPAMVFSRCIDAAQQLSPRTTAGVSAGAGAATAAAAAAYSTVSSITFPYKHGDTNSREGVKSKYQFCP